MIAHIVPQILHGFIEPPYRCMNHRKKQKSTSYSYKPGIYEINTIIHIVLVDEQ